MLPSTILLGLALSVSGAFGRYVSHEGRQVDCSQYGSYPAYTGPCEATNCGASGINCLAQKPRYSGCVGYPALGCPYKGCACTRY